MSYRRTQTPGATYFFTVVTYQRKPLFRAPDNVQLLRDAFRHVKQRYPYIHYNPVKHGLARAPREWPYSSFGRYVKARVYTEDWGANMEISFADGIGYE